LTVEQARWLLWAGLVNFQMSTGPLAARDRSIEEFLAI